MFLISFWVVIKSPSVVNVNGYKEVLSFKICLTFVFVCGSHWIAGFDILKEKENIFCEFFSLVWKQF